ncbi:MAG: tetratricopeptide repeat protein [Bacteroidia bacterium]|nr:tetratricopeptide repeat protein [Bacteroidia bacterium]
MKKNFLTLLFLILLSFSPNWWCLSHKSLAQETKIDSLFRVVKKQLRDTNEVKALNLLSEKVGWRIGNIDTALLLANQALKLSNLLDYKQGKSKAFGNMGLSYQMEGNYSLALKYYFLTARIREELKDKRGLATIINNIGNVYNHQSNYTEALKYYFKSLKIREEINDKRGISDAYTCIGNVYFHQLNFNEALQYHFKSLEIKKEINEKLGLAYVYGNIGNVYVDQKKYTEALKHFDLSLNVCKEIADSSGILLNYDNIGICYIKLNEYEKALPNFQLMYNIASKLDYKWETASSLINMGLIYFKQHKLMLAKESVLKGLTIAKEQNVLDLISESYNYLMLIEDASGNYKEALNNNILFNTYNDSLFNVETAKNVVQQQMRYDFNKQRTADSLRVDEEKRLREFKFYEEKKRNQLIIVSVIVVLIIISIFSILIYNRFRITKRQNVIIEHQKVEVENQKLIVESQKNLVEEKHKEITDSINYAVRIQRALLANKQILDTNLKEYFVFFKPKDIVSGDFYWAASVVSSSEVENNTLPKSVEKNVSSSTLNNNVSSSTHNNNVRRRYKMSK